VAGLSVYFMHLAGEWAEIPILSVYSIFGYILFLCVLDTETVFAKKQTNDNCKLLLNRITYNVISAINGLWQ
jgi:hypothetical protein